MLSNANSHIRPSNRSVYSCLLWFISHPFIGSVDDSKKPSSYNLQSLATSGEEYFRRYSQTFVP